MKYLFVYVSLFLHSGLAFAQKINFRKISVASIELLQKDQGATIVTYDYTIGVSGDYFPNRKDFLLAQTIVYEKAINSFNFKTSYYYSKQDSLVRLIEYEWEGTDNCTENIFQLTVKRNKEGISKFFKSPGKEIPETDTKAPKTIWENETVYVEQFYIPGMFRIRILISWK